jgi:serine/threonine protein kinase
MINPATYNIKLVDLGLACDNSMCDMSGTLDYMPDKFYNYNLSTRQAADIWAIGIVLIELTTSRDKFIKITSVRKEKSIIKLYNKELTGEKTTKNTKKMIEELASKVKNTLLDSVLGIVLLKSI